MKSLLRSPLKTVLTLLLLSAAAFLLLYNLSEYAATDRQYREALEHYEGVLTVEEAPVPEQVDARYNFFLLTDPTNPGRTFDRFSYEEYHHQSLSGETVSALSALPYISRIERRYITAGVSEEYLRLDTDTNLFPYNARLIVEGTLERMEELAFVNQGAFANIKPFNEDASAALVLTDIRLLAGDPAQLKDDDTLTAELRTLIEEKRDVYVFNSDSCGWSDRFAVLTLDLGLYREDFEALEQGHRYVFVLRGVNPWSSANDPKFGDDSRIDWWPYITDVTDLPENWLETEAFADLRELIAVTNDDLHTFDVVYGDDMASIQRIAEGRIVCMEGRFLTPADAGMPYCVVSKELLEQTGLKVGDTLTLRLGNYLCEQYAPLGAVASTRGRYSTAFQTQTFTIIGAYMDLNEGKHVNRDLYWCYSNNAVFVPSAFLTDCVNADTYTAKPPEMSFVVGNAEDILPFMEECLPQVEAMGLTYTFSDGGWPQVSAELMQARDLSLMKALIFAVAALFALVLTIWLFITRKKQEYGIYRALGMAKREASWRLFFPLCILGAVSAVLGTLAAFLVTLRKTTAAVSGALFLLGGLGFLGLLALLSWGGILLLRRKSILELVQGGRK